MTPDSPKGPACNCAPCRHEAAERTAPIPYLRRHVAEAIYDALKIYNRADVDVAADAIVAMVRPELERLTAELQAQNRLYRAVGSERDEKQFEIERLRRWVDRFRERAAEHAAEVSRLREQLAAATATLSELVTLKDGPRDVSYHERKPLAWQTARVFLAGAPFSESVPATPQQDEDAVLFAVAQDRVRRDKGVRHTLEDVAAELELMDEGRPSGSERLAPRPRLAYADRMLTECCASEGVTGIDCRLPKGHADWHSGRFDPTGEGYESGYPVCIQWPRNEWDRCEPEQVAAQAARSEATPKWVCMGESHDADLLEPCADCVPSPSLRKEGDTSSPSVSTQEEKEGETDG